MAKRKCVLEPVVETVEVLEDYAEQTIMTGTTKSRRQGNIKNGRFTGVYFEIGEITGHRERGVPIFHDATKKAAAVLEQQTDLPKEIHHLLGEPCIENLHHLEKLWDELHKHSEAEQIQLPWFWLRMMAEPSAQQTLLEVMKLAFQAGEQCGKLEVARLALVGLRDRARRSRSNRKRSSLRSEEHKARNTRLARIVSDELLAQSSRGERQHRGRAYEAVAERLDLSKRTVQKAFLTAAQSRLGACAT